MPEHALKALIGLDVDACSGIYPFKQMIPGGPMLTAGKTYPQCTTWLKLGEAVGKIVGEDGVWVVAGNGCMLVKRGVFVKRNDWVDAVKFRWVPGSAGSDVRFWREIQNQGFQARLHGGVVCGHLPMFPLKLVEELAEKCRA